LLNQLTNRYFAAISTSGYSLIDDTDLLLIITSTADGQPFWGY